MTVKRKKKVPPVLIILLALLLLAVILFIDSNTRLVTTEYRITDSALPAGFDGFRVVELSDLHAKRFGKNNEKLIAAVRAARPDIIAITGDLTDAPGQLDYAAELVDGLTAIAPVYYVSGNHEWASGTARAVFALMREHGATTLRNRFIRLERGGDEITLAGLDDPNGLRDQKTLPEVRQDIRDAGCDGFIILLAHRNDPEIYDGQALNVVFCGHGHGGLIRLPFTDGLLGHNGVLFPQYTSGVRTLSDGCAMVISRGLGNGKAPPRFLNNPELVVAELRAG